MSRRDMKAFKRLPFCALVMIALIISCTKPVFAAGEYTIYNASTVENGEDVYYATTATSQSDYNTSTDALVYCINMEKSRPQPNSAGISGYTKTSQATDDQINANIAQSDNAKYIRAVLYYGYPNLGNNNEWMTKYEADTGLDFNTSEYYMRVYTQAAIWYFSDNYSGGNSQDPGYTLKDLAQQNADSIPSDFAVDLYTNDAGTAQNFIGLESADTSEETTSVSVKVNKTWVFSTGGTYTGTKPTVSFTLYEGEGTTGTSYGPLTLGDDGTVTFTNVDTTSTQTFTLTESISGTVTGYTFTKAEDQTIDLSSTADGGTYEVDVTNSVTTTEEEEDSTSVSVQVNKTWELSSGGIYDGTKPEVSFTLYEGEGTTGTAYGPLTLGEDGTVTFTDVDTTSEKTFTLVETISGTVTGYTFTPMENTIIDLTDVADGETYEADVTNTVMTTETEEENTEISIKVNKTWELSTGETYSGTKPEVTFTLYGGEGTTGTNYGTVTLGEDDTAVFENIDAGDYEKFTLVENINGTVDGYTFQPSENIVVDINDLSEDNILTAEAVNEVTAEKVVKTNVPDTGDNTPLGLYCAVMVIGAIGVTCLVKFRKRTVK